MFGQFAVWARMAGRAMFTEQDNTTLCPVRIFGIPFAIIASSVYLGLALHTVLVLKTPLDYVSFGTGLSSIWLTVSAAIVGKAKWCES